MTTINITTLGCPKNLVDSQHLRRLFTSEGFVYRDDPKNADILLINTCGFIREAKEESIEEILSLARMKTEDKKLIVFGCLAKRYRDELAKEIDEIDGIWGVGEDDLIIEYCRQLREPLGKSHRLIVNTNLPITHYPLPTPYLSYAYLKIAEGCDRKCTFCVIPSIRGKYGSVPPETLIKEAEEHIQQGVKEIIVVAQDITSYGKEFGSYNLVSLLKDIVSLQGDFRVRLLYLYPSGINDDLLELVATEYKIQKYLDIPLQHSEDRILRLMRRRGTRKEYTKLIRHVRRTIPGIALRTTFIVGFPTETEEDFNGLVDFVEEVGFERLGVFKYSREEGTPASKLRGQIPENVKNRRFDEVMSRQALISLEKNKELVGRRYEAIIDEISGDVTIARLYSHAPEIDGSVIIEDKGCMMQGAGIKVGNIVTVEILDALDYDLKGRLIP